MTTDDDRLREELPGAGDALSVIRAPFPGSFDDVLSAAQGGEGRAFAELWRWLAPSVAGYFRNHGERDADDLTSETFLRVHRDLAMFDGDETRFRSWVFVIAHHRWIDHRRYAARRPMPQLGDVSLEGSVAPQVVERAESAEEVAVAALGTDEARRMVLDLVDDQRDVLLLRVFGDMTIEQIARALDKSVGATKALQRRALANLARAVGSGHGRAVPVEDDPTVTEVP